MLTIEIMLLSDEALGLKPYKCTGDVLTIDGVGGVVNISVLKSTTV